MVAAEHVRGHRFRAPSSVLHCHHRGRVVFDGFGFVLNRDPVVLVVADDEPSTDQLVDGLSEVSWTLLDDEAQVILPTDSPLTPAVNLETWHEGVALAEAVKALHQLPDGRHGMSEQVVRRSAHGGTFSRGKSEAAAKNIYTISFLWYLSNTTP